MLTSKWSDKGIDKELNEFIAKWTGADKSKIEDQVKLFIVNAFRFLNKCFRNFFIELG